MSTPRDKVFILNFTSKGTVRQQYTSLSPQVRVFTAYPTVLLNFNSLIASSSTPSKQIPKDNKIKKKKLYGPFLWMGFNCLKA